ncbi:cytochrome d ubiquinol oxidase subunit II [Cesiribacter andamanensis]|uniref:Cytochrome d ubiquinol oxidase subunit 2 n=1 Tax=Cesiribacter andamanensis AMV16 TaxID=1279009 RepID=M7N4W5_9BACT|nr:cytochrome d ubiquinol oxidase subunit II [Cesiribacter andamanensis]EMR02337.1 Cytochrome d ubiquinol oxidase subunit 2 [Cesiribacter andamanensis AMV16]
MMLAIVILFLVISLLFYVLFGGADFGAGIIEAFASRHHHHTISKAIAPVWEANHIWLILVVVILFMGFPPIYAEMSRFLHLPLLALLIGIVLRGCAFTFRHYDAVHDRSQRWYTLVFRVSSLFTPLFLGMVAGGMLLGRIPAQLEGNSYYSLFIAPWFNLFCLAVGVFTTCLFAFLAAVYLIGEARESGEQKRFVRAARWANLALVLSGALVFGAAAAEGLPLLATFLGSAGALLALGLATLSLPLLWLALLRQWVILSRLLAGLQTLLVLGAWFWTEYPVALRYTNGMALTLFEAAAPQATLQQLGLALLVGSALILPSLYFLLRTFKKANPLQV